MLHKSKVTLRLESKGLALLVVLGAAALSACSGDDASPAAIPPPTPLSAPRPPPPISGGTLLVAGDNTTAVVSDPDRDRIVLADLGSKSVLADIALDASDEPGRIVEGPAGRVHVALRRGGDVVTIDLASKKIIRRTEVCPAPRGMAYVNGSVHVACAGGELVTLSADSGAVLRSLVLPSDLRDIVVQGDHLLVSQFRSSMVFDVDATGNIVGAIGISGEFFNVVPAVAWRMVPRPEGGVAMVHQTGLADVVFPHEGGYGQSPGCGGTGIVNSRVSFLDAAAPGMFSAGADIQKGALPVDLAFSANGTELAVVAAGSNAVLSMYTQAYRDLANGFDPCGAADATIIEEGEPVAVAFADSMRVIQTREPARLVFGDKTFIELGGESMLDTGHRLFHHAPNPMLNMACASCHPEGRDDGRVWFFGDVGSRRTQSVAGGILATAPLHWDGALEGFDALMNDVFTGRMGGETLSPPLVLATAAWIDSVPLLPVSPAADLEAVERGKALFESTAVGCANCHSGPRLTNNLSVDVGTNGTFQVPSLRGIASRAPFMHDGCAPTLADRFSPYCGGGDKHGATSNLTQVQIDDLVRYLETL
jgi:hypothetical protein